MEAINGVSCIKGEIHSIVTLMRIHTRWSMQGRTSREIANFDEDPIMQSFRKLNEYLEGLYDLREVDCVTYLFPFHQVIVSDKASGFLTSTSLSSIAKFVSYGFLRPEFPRVCEGIAMIVNCIQRCIFEETDWESDEVILMKLLELAALLLRCESSSLLTIGDVWGIYETCISIHSTKASKILRSEAETALRNLTLTIFSRAHAALQAVAQTPADPTRQASEDGLVRRIATDFIFPTDIRGQSWEQLGKSYNFEGPVGVTLLLAKAMTVLSSLMDSQSQPANEVKFALSLVNIALESGGPALGSMGPLVDVLRGDVCRHLLRATQSDDLAVLSFSLRVVFNLFVSIKDHMKVQLEVFLTSVHLRLLFQSQQVQQQALVNNSSMASLFSPLQTAREELALESLLEFCREPSLMQDLYSNYDCDVQCTNLFDIIITALCARAIPNGIQPSAFNGIHDVTITDLGGSGSSPGTRGRFILIDPYHACRISILNKLALDGVFAVLHAVAGRCATNPTANNPSAKGSGYSRKDGDFDEFSSSPVDGGGELSSSSRYDNGRYPYNSSAGTNGAATAIPVGVVPITRPGHVTRDTSSSSADNIDQRSPSTPTGRRSNAANTNNTNTEGYSSSPEKPDNGFATTTATGTGRHAAAALVDDWCTRDSEAEDSVTPPPSSSNNNYKGLSQQSQSQYQHSQQLLLASPQSDIGEHAEQRQRESSHGGTSPLTADALASLSLPQLTGASSSISRPSSRVGGIEISSAPATGGGVSRRDGGGEGGANGFAVRRTSLHRGGSSLSSSDVLSIDGGNGGGGGGGDEDVDGLLLARAKTAEELRQRKLKKQRLKLAAEKFNDKPLSPEWVRFALSLGLLQPAATDVAEERSGTGVSGVAVDAGIGIGNDGGAVSTSSSMKEIESSGGIGTPAPGQLSQQLQQQQQQQSAAAAAAGNATTKKLKNKSIAFAIVEARSVAKFLKNTPGLGKTQIGEFLSKGPKEMYPFHADVLHEYVGLFDFTAAISMTFDHPLRTFLGFFRLPGEAQCIDRLMEAFAQKVFHDLGPNNPFASADAAFILAFSTIMLNTDLHNPQIAHSKRMTKEEFIRNNRQINDGKDLPREYMESLYDEIKSRQIQVDLGINDSDVVGVPVALDYTDTATWNKLLRKSAQDQAPAAFTPTVAARRGRSRGSILPPSVQERDMFLVMAKPVLEAMLIAWEVVDDDQLLSRLIQGVRDFSSVCNSLGFNGMLSRLVQILATRAVAVLVSVRLPSKVQSTKSGGRPSTDQASWGRNKSSLFRLLETDLGNMVRRSPKNKTATSPLIPSDDSIIDDSHHCEDSSGRSPQPGGGGGDGPTSPSINGGEGDENLDWTGAHRLRGEMMMRMAFHIARSYSAVLGPEAWAAIAKLLLYVRGRGALPPALAIVSEDVQQMAIDGFGLSPSAFALDCHALAKNTPATAARRLFSQIRAGTAGDSGDRKEGDSDKGGSIWSSVASLGGLLWSSGSSSSSTAGQQRITSVSPIIGAQPQVALSATSLDKNRGLLSVGEYSILSGSFSDRIHPSGNWTRLDANSCLFNNRLNPSYVNDGAAQVGGGVYVSAAVAMQDELLRVGIHACQPDTLLFESVTDLDAVALQGTVDSLVDVLTDIVNSLINRPSVSGSGAGPGSTGIGGNGSNSNSGNSASTVAANASASNVTGSGVIVNVQRLSVPSGTIEEYSPTTAQGSPNALTAQSNKSVDAHTSLHASIVLTRCELDAVILLEWLTDLIFVSSKHLEVVWPKVHGFFRNILEEKIDGACVACPYFVERCIVAILRAASHLLPSSQALEVLGREAGGVASNPQFKYRTGTGAFESPMGFNANKGSVFGNSNAYEGDYSLTPSSRVSGLQSLWLSLRLIRAVPNEILWVISDHLAAGMLSLLKVSPGAAGISTLEQWYMVFSLLSAASAGPSGRPLVWEAICYLIDSNAVNDMNFTPCRHLLLRYLQGVFPGDISDTARGRSPSLGRKQTSSSSSPWQSSALFHLMRLTNMAMAGYARSHHSKSSISHTDLTGGTGSKVELTPTSVAEVPPKPSKAVNPVAALAPFDDPSRLHQSSYLSTSTANNIPVAAGTGYGLRGLRGGPYQFQHQQQLPQASPHPEVVAFPLPPRHFSSHRISLTVGALPVKTHTSLHHLTPVGAAGGVAIPPSSSVTVAVPPTTPAPFLGTPAASAGIASYQSPGATAVPSVTIRAASPSLANTDRSSFRSTVNKQGSPGGSSSGVDWPTESSITVVSVRFARDEEVELLWLETVKAFADISNSDNMECSKKAIFCLEAICLSGRIAGLPDAIWVRSVAELLNRLPLNVSTFTQHLPPVNHSDATDCCLRCCNIIFEMFVANLRPLRQHDEFQSYWLRFTGLLSMNLNTVDRWSQVYDEILEMIAALMRLLQPLPQTQAPSTPLTGTAAGQIAHTGTSSSAAGSASAAKQKENPKGSVGGGGIFGFFSPFWGAASSGSDVNVIASTEGLTRGSVQLPAVRRASSPSASSSSSIGLNSASLPSTPMQATTMATSGDATLIALSWRLMCSQCTSLAASLKTKNAQLTADLSHCVEAVPLDASSVAAAAAIVTVSSPASVQQATRPVTGHNVDPRLAMNNANSYMPPPLRRPSAGSDSGFEESRRQISTHSHANLAKLGIAGSTQQQQLLQREVVDVHGSSAVGRPPVYRNGNVQQRLQPQHTDTPMAKPAPTGRSTSDTVLGRSDGPFDRSNSTEVAAVNQLAATPKNSWFGRTPPPQATGDAAAAKNGLAGSRDSDSRSRDLHESERPPQEQQQEQDLLPSTIETRSVGFGFVPLTADDHDQSSRLDKSGWGESSLTPMSPPKRESNGSAAAAASIIVSHNSAFTEVKALNHHPQPAGQQHQQHHHSLEEDDSSSHKIHISSLSPGVRGFLRKEMKPLPLGERGAVAYSPRRETENRANVSEDILSPSRLGVIRSLSPIVRSVSDEPDAAALQNAVSTAAAVYAYNNIQEEEEEEEEDASRTNASYTVERLRQTQSQTTGTAAVAVAVALRDDDRSVDDHDFNPDFWGPEPSQFINNVTAYRAQQQQQQQQVLHSNGKATTVPATETNKNANANANNFTVYVSQDIVATSSSVPDPRGDRPYQDKDSRETLSTTATWPVVAVRDAKMRRINTRTMVV